MLKKQIYNFFHLKFLLKFILCLIIRTYMHEHRQMKKQETDQLHTRKTLDGFRWSGKVHDGVPQYMSN